jgi:hypothetical protein
LDFVGLGTALLNNMGKFVSQELLARVGARLISPLAKEDIGARGKGRGTKGTVKLIGGRVGVNPHSAKVGAQGGANIGARLFIQGLPTTSGRLDLLLQTVAYRAACLTFRRLTPGAKLGTLNEPLHSAVAVGTLKLIEIFDGD